MSGGAMKAAEVSMKKTKLEDGDIMFINVVGVFAARQLCAFRKQMKDIVEEQGVKADVIVTNVENLELTVLKSAQLNDIHQRLDDLERGTQVRVPWFAA